MTDYLKLAAESPEPTAPTGANPYLDLAKQDQMAEQARARSIIEMALKDNPDVAAERQRLAKTSGLPLRVIERNLDEVRLKEQARAIDLLKMSQDSPVLARQMTDPTFTTLAIDDVDTLTEIERSVGHAVRYMLGAAPGGGVVGGLKASLYRSAGAFAGAKRAAVDVVEPWARLVAGDDNWFAGMSRYYADQIKANDAVAESLSPRTGSTIGDGVSSGVQSFGQNAKYLPLALAGPGGAGLALGGMVMESFGTSYGKAADKNLPLWQKLGYASTDAMVEYWTEKIPMDALIGGIRQGAPFIQVLAKQMALEIPGEQLATVLQDLNEWATLNPGKPFADYVKERPDAAAQTLIATVIGTGGNVAVTSGVAKIADSIAGPAWRDNLTKTYADMLSEQLKLAGQSALRERSPEQFRAHVQRVVDSAEGASRSVYVDGEVLNQLPAEVLNQLPESVREQIADAAATGDTVEIPMADVLTVAPGTPLEQVLNEHARMDPFASSKAEVAAAQDVLKQEAERVIQQAADAQVAQQEFDTVKAMYAEQITATGRYRPAVAEQMGTWIASFYTAYGSRVGMTPTQFQQRYPVRVAGVPSGQGTVLNDGGQPGRIDGVEAYHYSMAPRAVLSSSAYGTGLRGSARDEIMAHPDKRLRHRISFYVDKGTGVRPEAGVGGVAHRVNLDNIYDANADPLRLRSGDARAFETRVLDAGFSGYLDRLDGDQPGQVILLGEQNVTPEVLGPVGRIEAGKKLPALPRKAAQWKTQASGTPEMLQARLERMQASSAWQNYDIRIEGNELQVREKDGVFEQSGRDGGDTTYADKARALLDSRPAPVLSTVALMDGKEEAPRFKTITDLAAHFTKKNRGKARDLSDPKVQAKIADALYAEALHGLTDAGNAIGWYDRKTKAALDIITEAHPELATDEQARFAFIAILAVTSNGLRSRDNFVIAERLYRENWKADKRFPESVPDGGPRSNQMGEALALLNRKIDELGWQAVRDFMESKHTAKEVRDFAGANSFFGEQAAAEVPGALFLGPKLGSFFNNLYGDFSTVTMDRWFMRTVNRIRGNMLSLPGSFTKNLGALRQQIEAGVDTFGVKPEKILAEIAAFEMARPEQQADVLFARSKLKAVQQYARARYREYARPKDDGTGKKRSFLERTPENYLAKTIDLAMSGSNDAPSAASDRTWIRGVIDQVQARFAKDGIEISNADLQAVLWYYEKDVYAKLISRGGQDVRLEEDAEPKEAEDYETAARYAVGRLRGTGVLAGTAGQARPGDGGRGTGDAGTLAQDGVDPGGSQVNIGLADPNGGPNLDPEIVLRALDVIGAEVQDSNVQVSDSEPTLVAKLKQALTPEQGNLLSRVLDQEAVAQQRAQKAGDLFGPMADKWGPFNPQFFVTMTGERGVTVLWQNPQQPRGTFNPATLELVLNPNANLSTWFHETGHFFLEVMADIASQPGAPTQIVEDFGTFLKWAGITGDETVGGADSGVPLGQQAEDADAVYQEIAADQEMIDALEVYMVSGDPPEGALNDKLVAYLRRLPPVPADSYLTFYRNQPRGVRAWGRGWASWTTNEDQTRFFGGRDFEVLKRKGAQGINLERLGEARGRITGDYHQYGSQAEWLLLNESVGLNQDGQPTPATQPGAPTQIVEDFNTFLKWAGITGDETVGGVDSGAPLAQSSKLTNDKTVYWHGSVSMDLRGGNEGLHLGTKLAAMQALEARIGVPAEGTWDGTREYGKTLLAGRKTLERLEKERGYYLRTGLNAGGPNNPVPEEDYYPTPGTLKYADGTLVPMTMRPDIKPFRLKTEMSNSRSNPYEDFKANGYMRGALKKGNAKRGYYYGNIAEDAGSISVVVPNGDHVEPVDPAALAQDGPQATSTQPLPKRRTPLETWNAMTLDQKRPYHERWAESIEQYVMEGKAPSVELQPLMRRFSAWLKSVYGSIKQFLAARGVPVGGGDALNQRVTRNDKLAAWFGTGNTMVNEDGTPRVLYHGTTKAGARGVKAGQFRRSKTGAMGPAVYLGDSAEASAGYDDGAMLRVYARGKYLSNAQWSEYVSAHGWKGAEAAATADGWAGVYDQEFENATAVWNPENIKSVDAKQFADDGTLLGQDPNAQPGPALQLNDDIRRVMDRMLATDEQIQQANEVAGLVPDEAADGVAEERLRKRSIADLKWAVKARDAVIAKLKKEARAIEKAIRERVTEEVDAMPEMRAKAALDALQVDTEYDGVLKAWKDQRAAAETAAREEVKAALLADNPDAQGLAKGQLLAKNKRDLDNKVDAAMIKWDAANPRPSKARYANDQDLATVADSFGYESVDAMLQAIAAFDRRDLIDGMTEQRMLEEHGDLIDERAMQAAANEAVHNEARARSLATELRTQAEMLNPRTDTGETTATGRRVTVNALVEAAKQFAANVVGKTSLRDLKAKAWQHTAAERRASKRWQEATAAGKTQDAVKAKQDQMLNHAAAKAAIDAQAEAREILDFFARVTKGNDETVVEKGRDADLVNAARAVLAAYGVQTPASKGAEAYLESLAKHDPETYNVVKPMVDAATQNAQPLEALTFDELQALHEEVQAIWFLAKRTRQMEVDGDLLDVDDVAQELYSRMEEIGIPDEVPGERGALTRGELLARQWLQQAPALLRRVEQWAEAKDGKFGGPFLRFIFQPVKDAADRYRTARLEYRKKFQSLVDNIAPMMTPGTIDAPELGYVFGRGHNGGGMAELLHAIAHTGNESNKRKLLLGRQWATELPDGTLDTSRWDAFIQRLTNEGRLQREHFDFVQGVWDLLEETKPLAQKTHREVFGRYFAEVTADAFVDPFGVSRRGGYIPAQADPLLVQDADLRELLETENVAMSQAFPQTNRGFTKSRVEYNRPLKLDLRTLPQHIDKVLLFAHMEPAVRGVARVLRRPKVSQPLARIDPAAMGAMLKPWLNRSARQTVETPISADAGLNRMASAVRGRVGMALMFANVSNTLQQITGSLTASIKVKPGLMMRATAQFIANPKKFKQSVWDISPYMADRAANEVAVLSDTLDKILVNPSVWQSAEHFTRRHAYFLQTAFDNQMSPIIWTASYNQALADGVDERMAVRFADGVIRQTQGSTLPEDVSRIETGPAYARLFTQFVGYFNMMANTNATAIQQIAAEQGLRKGAGKAFYTLLLGLLAPIWVAEAIAHAMRGGPDDEDDDGWLDDWLVAVFGFGTIRGLLSGVPFLGAVGQSVVNRFNRQPADDKFSLSPTVSVLESAAGAPASVYKAIVDDKSKQKAVRDTAALITVLTGLPAMAVARPLGYAAGMADDRINPTGPADMARGLVTGTASPESRTP